jgi:glycosyltransferase involved in cell wall biosynthesis
MDTKQANPNISVILNTYNSAKYIDSCVNSILLQTYKDFELIILDCSDDDTFVKLCGYKDTRIRIRRIETRISLAKARNISISEARGNYIALMDADDICLPNRLEVQLEHIESVKADICGSWYYELNSNTGQIKKHRTPTHDSDIKALLTVYNPICNPTSFFKKSILRQVPYREDFLYAEDSEMWAELALRSTFTIAPQYLIYYRVHDTQLSKEVIGAPIVWFNKARDEYLKKLLSEPLVVQRASIDRRLVSGFDFLTKLNSRLPRISFMVNYQIYSRFQPKNPRLFSPLRRLERILLIVLLVVSQAVKRGSRF